MVRSPSGRECVYWDTRGGLESAPRASGAVDFWLETASERVLVRADRLEVEAVAQRRQEVLGQVDHDIHEVSRRSRAVKDALREGSGDAKALGRERKRLAQLATLLCAVRAQARGRVHVGGSLAGQSRWIAEHAKEITAGPGAKTLRLVVDQWETVIAPGDEVEIEGERALEPAPPGLGHGGGYRERASIGVLRAPEGGALVVRGAARPQLPSGRWAASAPPRSAPDPSTADRTLVAIVAAATGTLVVLAWLLAR